MSLYHLTVGNGYPSTVHGIEISLPTRKLVFSKDTFTESGTENILELRLRVGKLLKNFLKIIFILKLVKLLFEILTYKNSSSRLGVEFGTGSDRICRFCGCMSCFCRRGMRCWGFVS